MIHARHSARRGVPAQGPFRFLAFLSVLLVGVPMSACGDGGAIDPETLRFGQIGRIEIRLETPLRGGAFDLGVGRHEQTLLWSYTGAWTLRESVSYRGLTGDETVHRQPRDPAHFAAAYASLITQLNEVEGLRLFIEDLPPNLAPECGPTRTRLTFTIQDDARGRSVSWVRCAEGSLGTLTPIGAGPDAAASRLVVATLLAREATVGEGWISAYLGTVPFGTLDRGEDSNSPLTAPATYIDPRGFQAFWAEHAPSRAPPSVDFTREMVVVGIVGVRKEAGDSVEVRRILQVDQGTLIEVVERQPGNFCSPAARTHVPYHIVVSPRTPIPHRFAEIKKERPPCGG